MTYTYTLNLEPLLTGALYGFIVGITLTLLYISISGRRR